MGPDEKLEWVLQHRLLFDLDQHHEVFSLLEKAFPDASQGVRERVWTEGLEATTRTEGEDDDDPPPPFVQWIATIDPGFAPAQEAVEAYASSHEGWQPRPEPDLLWRTNAGWRPLSRRTPVDGLTYGKIRELEIGDEQPMGWGLLEQVSDAIIESPALGTDLLLAAAEEGAWDSSVWRASIWAYQRVPPGVESWPKLVETLARHPDPLIGIDALSMAGLTAVRAEPRAVRSDQLGVIAETLGASLLRIMDAEIDIDPPGSDYMFAALNQWPGRLAQYLAETTSVLEDEGADPCDAPGLSAYITASIGHQDRSWAQVSLAALGRLLPYFLNRCRDSLGQPIVDALAGTGDGFLPLWTGLAYANWDRDVVERTIELYPSIVARLDDFDSQPRHAIVQRLAAVATVFNGEGSQEVATWITKLVADNSDDVVSQFVGAIDAHIDQGGDALRLEVWDRWLGDFIDQRCNGFPKAVGPEEGTRLIRLIAKSPGEFCRRSDCLQRLPVGPYPLDLFDVMVDAQIAESCPEQTVRVVAHLVSSARYVSDSDGWRRIREEAQSKGVTQQALGALDDALVAKGLTPQPNRSLRVQDECGT